MADTSFYNEFALVPTQIWLEPLSSGAKHTFCILSAYAKGDDVRVAFPGVDVLAERMSVTRKTVSKWLTELEDGGYIAKEQVKAENGKGWAHNVYILNMESLSAKRLMRINITLIKKQPENGCGACVEQDLDGDPMRVNITPKYIGKPSISDQSSSNHRSAISDPRSGADHKLHQGSLIALNTPAPAPKPTQSRSPVYLVEQARSSGNWEKVSFMVLAGYFMAQHNQHFPERLEHAVPGKAGIDAGYMRRFFEAGLGKDVPVERRADVLDQLIEHYKTSPHQEPQYRRRMRWDYFNQESEWVFKKGGLWDAVVAKAVPPVKKYRTRSDEIPEMTPEEREYWRNQTF